MRILDTKTPLKREALGRFKLLHCFIASDAEIKGRGEAIKQLSTLNHGGGP